MKAYTLHGTNTADALQLTELPIPEIQENEVLIRVRALAVNPIDSKTLQGKGQYNTIKTDTPIILGWDISGEIVASKSDRFQQGDEVFGLINFPGHGKAYAEYVAAPDKDLAKKPTSVSHEKAVATSLSALTALQSLEKARIQSGERVLIQGAAGGVGFFAVQLAKRQGATVIGTAAAKDEALLKQHGLDDLIEYHTTDFSEVARNIDFVLDTLGGEQVIKAFKTLSPNGRIITLPSGAGDDWKVAAKEQGIRAESYVVHSSGTDMQSLAGWLESGALVPKIDHTFTFQDIPAIHQQLLDKQINGKIIVTLP